MKFEDIYKEYWQKVYRICMGYVNDHDCAKDMAQETFISVFQQLQKFRKDSSVGTWVFRIATNKCLRQIERQNRFPKTNFPKDLPEEKQTDNEPQVQFLYKFISELSEIDRIIISLELEDIRQAEIAKILGMTESNIRVKIHRIKEKLNLKFKENG